MSRQYNEAWLYSLAASSVIDTDVDFFVHHPELSVVLAGKPVVFNWPYEQVLTLTTCLRRTHLEGQPRQCLRRLLVAGDHLPHAVDYVDRPVETFEHQGLQHNTKNAPVFAKVVCGVVICSRRIVLLVKRAKSL